LKHAARCPNLQRLSIGDWRTGGPAEVTDAGLLALSAAKKLKQVDVMRRNTKITEAAIERLRTQRPNLTLNIR
jgi:hypothetical protein